MSSRGGKIFLPAPASRSKNRFRSKNSLVTISAFKWASQLSCRVSISSLRSCLCSSVRLATHLALSNLGPVVSDTAAVAGPLLSRVCLVPLAAEAVDVGLGVLKKEVMLAFGLTFLGSRPA